MPNLERIQRGLKSIQDGFAVLSQGPAEYDLKCMLKATELLVTKYAPFKVGQRVELAATPIITKDKSYGWLHSKHFLVEGAQAVVASVDFDSEDLSFHVIFDDESWIDRDGKVNPIPPERKHTYGFRAEALRLTEDRSFEPPNFL